MSTTSDMNDASRARDEFNIARAEAIDAYAELERSLMFLLSLMIGGKQHHSSIILSRLHNTRSRNVIIQKIVDNDTNKKYRLFTNSAFKMVSEADEFRNHLVHWHMIQMNTIDRSTSGEKYYALIPTGPLTGKFPRIYKKEIDDFRVKTKFLALQLNNFETFLNPEIPLSDDWPQPLRDIFLQALSYPPQAGHPQYRNYKGLLAQIEPSRP